MDGMRYAVTLIAWRRAKGVVIGHDQRRIGRGPARDPRRHRGPRTGRRAERAAGPHPAIQRNRKTSHA